MEARIVTLTAGRERFSPWRTIQGQELADTRLPQLQVLVEGVLEKHWLLAQATQAGEIHHLGHRRGWTGTSSRRELFAFCPSFNRRSIFAY